MEIRIGHGFDVHPFEGGRPLRLGGVTIPHEVGLKGHSDADVLLHALSDAILGALSWGDIGKWFPDTEKQYAGIDSVRLLDQIWVKVAAEGWQLINCDSVILAEKPKLLSYVPEMQKIIAATLQSDPTRIGIKATTTEKLGFVGREEGIAASSVVLLQKK